MRIAALVDENLAQGLRAAGAWVATATDPAGAEAQLRVLLGDREVAVVLVSGAGARAAVALEGELGDPGAVVLDLDDVLR